MVGGCMFKEWLAGYRRKSYDKMDERDNKLLMIDGIILSDEASKKRGNIKIDDTAMASFTFLQKIKFFKDIMPNLIKCRKIQERSIESIEENPEKPKTLADNAFIKELEIFAKSVGAKDIGYIIVPRELIFKDKGILYKNAIVLTMEMDKEKMSQAPSFDTLENVMKTYADLGEIANKVADFLRKNGYGAHASPAMGGLVFYPRLAEMAGMGVRGRHGLLISPGSGPRQRIAAVFTSITNLQLPDKNSHEWAREFCKNCGRCIKKCPAKAIHEVPEKTPDGWIKFVDGDKCNEYFGKNFGCSICIKECPFNTTGYDNLKAGYDRKNSMNKK